ncbi:MGF 360-21R [African swine fever virus]|uniref:MGF 360-21R n=1 Tax=African swine fever virus TaxID=10497 RepID=A0A0C5B2C7_ASF|nr:MGF 360-21R [African swine fever virus]AJL34171.1 MGF 360-21R [African swine fever virus]
MPTPSSLQVLVKRVLDYQHHVSEDDYCILQHCGLWWHGSPIMFFTNENHQRMIKSASFKDGLEINLALMKAVQENNCILIELFTEWGADINYGLITVNTEYTRNLCRNLGAKEALNTRKILDVFLNLKDFKSSNHIILCHELLSNNPLLLSENNDYLRKIINCNLRRISINFILDEISFNEKLTRFWYKQAVLNNLTEAIQYFYQKYKQFKDWRLICGLALNNVFDLHEIYNKEKADIDINQMIEITCTYMCSYPTIYYCFVMGADINRAMITSVTKSYTGNLFFCIDLGATAFEECLEIAKQQNDNELVKVLSLKNYYSPDSSLLSLKITDPEKINILLDDETYESKNELIYEELI